MIANSTAHLSEEEAVLFHHLLRKTLSTPSVFMAYDMIPEVMQWDLHNRCG
jgi:hypothetical protein